jgi:hypothetical protein
MKNLFDLPQRLGSTIEGALFFGIFAPPIGSIPVSLALSINHLYGYRGEDNHLLYSVMSFFGLALLSYVFGGIPAMLVGAIAGFSRHWPSPKVRLAAIAILGGVFSLGFAFSLGATDLETRSDIKLIFGFFVIPGIFGGAVTAIRFSCQKRKPASRAR